jgi:hypothetical protein
MSTIFCDYQHGALTEQIELSRVSLSLHVIVLAYTPGMLTLYTFLESKSNPKEAGMPEAKGMWEGLMDFSFRLYATPRMLKFLYALHLLIGLIAAVAWVVLAFQQAPVQGLVALLGALVGYFFWILYCRIILEVLAAVFRMAAAIAPDRPTTEQQ